MKITRLEYQKKDPNRVNVYVDDKFVAGVDANDILKLDLFRGKEVEDVNKIIEISDFGQLFNKALNFLSYRPRTEWEVRFKFRGEEQLDNVIKKLKKNNQINDENFTKWFIDQRTTFKPKGKRALKFELARKGIDRKITDKVLSEVIDSESELAS